MKKGKYIDYYIIMACLSGKKSKADLKTVDELLNKICTGCNDEIIHCYGLPKKDPCIA